MLVFGVLGHSDKVELLLKINPKYDNFYIKPLPLKKKPSHIIGSIILNRSPPGPIIISKAFPFFDCSAAIKNNDWSALTKCSYIRHVLFVSSCLFAVYAVYEPGDVCVMSWDYEQALICVLPIL